MRKVPFLVIALLAAGCGGEEVVNDPFRLVYKERFTYMPTDMDPSMRSSEGIRYIRFDLTRQYQFTSGLVNTGLFQWESLPPEKAVADPIEDATLEGYTLSDHHHTFRAIAKAKNECGEYFVYELDQILGALECE